jgi:hypothetical protein
MGETATRVIRITVAAYIVGAGKTSNIFGAYGSLLVDS